MSEIVAKSTTKRATPPGTARCVSGLPGAEQRGPRSTRVGNRLGRHLPMGLLRPAIVLALLCVVRLAASGIAPTPDLRADGYPSGARPLGIDLVGNRGSGGWENVRWEAPPSLVVANSGDASVSIFRIKRGANSFEARYSLEAITVVGGIPSAYGVAGCNDLLTGNKALVTSPSDNSVVVISVPDGKILGKVAVGPRPQAVACFLSAGSAAGIFKGVVSNAGDDSLVVFDVDKLAIEARIAGVPAATGTHGIDVVFTANALNVERPYAWVAGTAADAISMVDLSTYQLLARYPAHAPTNIQGACASTPLENGVVCAYSVPDSLRTISFPIIDFSTTKYAMSQQQSFLIATTTEGVRCQLTGGAWKSVAGIPAPAGLVVRSYPLFVAVTSPDSDRVFVIQEMPPSAPLPQDFSVVNGASFDRLGVASGSLASTFLPTGVLQNLFPAGLPLPKALGGLSLRVGGSLAYDSSSSRWNYSPSSSLEAGFVYVGPAQVNFQMPPGTSAGNLVPAQLQLPNGRTLVTTLNVLPAAPGIFTVLMSGQGQGAVLNQDNSPNGDPKVLIGVKPAGRGSVIQIFATGAGETTPALAASEAAPAGGNPLVLTKVQPTVTIGGKSAKVQFSGMAPGFVGLWQINAGVPQDVTPGMAVALVITAAGASSNTVTVAVQ